MESLAAQVAELLTLAETEDVTDGELADLARRLSTAEQALEQLRLVASVLSSEISARVEVDITPVPGVGVIQRGYTRRSNWRHESSAAELRTHIGEAIVRAISLDIATGELDPAKRNISRATIEALWDILPSFSSVKQPAHRYGIRIGEYREFYDAAVVHIAKEAPL